MNIAAYNDESLNKQNNFQLHAVEIEALETLRKDVFTVMMLNTSD